MAEAQADRLAAGDPRPRSAVSSGVGFAGLAGLFAWLVYARIWQLAGPFGAIACVAACGLPMIIWSLLIDKVHRNPTTGLDWTRPAAPWRETIDVSITKLAGLWATWALIAGAYACARFYWSGHYLYAMRFLGATAPALVLLSVPYVLWLDRRLKEPRDGTYAFGRWLFGHGADRAAIAEHFRQWTIKAFFTAFMISIVPGNYSDVVTWNLIAAFADPVGITRFLIALMFLIDVAMATVGYVLTAKPLDAHIRSANPYAAGWTAALMCYPPFVLMGPGSPLDYHPGTQDWNVWLQWHPALLALCGAVLVGLTAIYAWATVAFGLRFSNLTHRGILTHGPYRWSKHPAYLSKNMFWWISTAPFLVTTGSIADAMRNSVILAVVSGIYYWRARTEEAHLSADPAYVAYAGWMKRNAPLPKLACWLRGETKGDPVAAE